MFIARHGKNFFRRTDGNWLSRCFAWRRLPFVGSVRPIACNFRSHFLIASGLKKKKRVLFAVWVCTAGYPNELTARPRCGVCAERDGVAHKTLQSFLQMPC